MIVDSTSYGGDDTETVKKFLSPVLKIIPACHKCRACVHACREYAIVFGLSDLEVDRKKCATRYFKNGECIDCAAACHLGAIALEWFEFKNGKIIPCD
ncbi:MAG: hypothetical protein RBG13Loki_1889 [Promethearchaeota archaeon CR_4]|nr:MAG: hypothetical protein RBG13Loki_1889 [Candidatus Lokiarchaeota archaeon CR_4]